MSDLVLSANISDADGFYSDLLAAHEGLSKEESDGLNARLILILANQIGDRNLLQKALSVAGNSVSTP